MFEINTPVYIYYSKVTWY